MDERNLEALFESAPSLIAVLRGPDHIFEVANAAYRRLLSDRDLIGRPVRDAVPELEAQGFVEILDEVYRSGEPYTAERSPVWLQRTGSSPERRYFNFIYQPTKDPAGAVTGIFAQGIDVTAFAEANVAREAAERRLNAVLDNASVAIFLMDERQHCSYMNAAAERLTGYTLAEVQGRPLHDVIHHTRPDGTHFPLEECAIDRAFPENNNTQGEEVFVHKDGHFYPVAFTASPIRDDGSRTVGTIIEARDISGRKSTDEALRLSLEKLNEESHALELLNRTGAQVAAELDLEKVVQLVVDAGVEITGAQFGAFFYNVEREDGERFMLYSLSGAKISDFEHFGMPRATPIFAATFANEGILRSDDITQDARYGKNAPHSGMPAGHLPVRSYLAVPVVSRSGEVVGGLFFGHCQPGIFDDRAERLMTGLAGQAAIAIDNARLYQAAQRAARVLEQRVADRTAELERTHEALRHAQKMEAIGQLTGGIAHDFNNLLTIIKGGADFLKRGDISEARRARYVEAIADTADRAAKLTAQLLAFARRQSLEPVVFDVVERVNAVTEMLRPVMGSRIQVQVRAQCDPCHVEADPNQLETAILNMSVNARDAMGGEGKLEITIAAVAGIPASAGAAAEEGSFVAIALTDTGSGIEPDKLERVFEPFFTTKGVGEGTGLGLSQVFGFAAQSGGHVRVESIVGAGSTFTLYLPKAEGEVSALGDREREAVSEDQPGGIVLIVEDNPQVADFACQLLADLGYEPHLAGNADQALDFLAAGRPVDVVFTDVVMPGISGVELGRKVQQMRPGLPVVITSGYSHILAEEGSQGFPLLHKPYSVDGLAKILRATLTREGAETHGMRQLVS